MSKAFDGLEHHPVLYHEIIHAIRPTPKGLYIDATLGAGGHAFGILEASSPDGCLLGLEIDPHALAVADQRLSKFPGRATLLRASYTTLSAQVAKLRWRSVNGILFDLGVSSLQIDSPERGFSFLRNGPLDMRFDPNSDVSAADLVNDLSQGELERIIFEYGDEKYARWIVDAIAKARPISTTVQLAELVSHALAFRKKYHQPWKIHPATKTFQALRIAVNKELEALEFALPKAIEALSPQGILAVISFHSLEDRIVKRFFRRESKDCLCPVQQPYCICGHQAVIRELNRRPIRPRAEEIEINPRARSARLRVVEKLNDK